MERRFDDFLPVDSTAARPSGARPRHAFGAGWILAAAAVGLATGLLVQDGAFRGSTASARDPLPRGELDPDERSTVALFERVSPSVVNIRAVRLQEDWFSRMVEIPQGVGTGCIWNESGDVLTNFHVVQRVTRGGRIYVTLADGSTHRGQVVGVAPERDLAVVRLDSPPDGLTPIPVGASEGLRVGQKVFAIGNPFGLDQSLTTGVVSALGREIGALDGRTITGVIQTDAAINPGNSGGPLLDSAGRMIGMNTAIYSPSGASAGISFAVPLDRVYRRMVHDLITSGRVIRAGLVVRLAEDSIARSVGLRKGALVLRVYEGTAAAEAGLRETTRDPDTERVVLGDVIVAVDGKPVETKEDLYERMEEYAVGDRVTLTVERDRRRQDIEVRLQQLN